MYFSQKLGEDFAKFCGLLRMYELDLFDVSFEYMMPSGVLGTFQVRFDLKTFHAQRKKKTLSRLV